MSFIPQSNSTDGRATTGGRALYSSRQEQHLAKFLFDGKRAPPV
jgi:hypothetical protein